MPVGADLDWHLMLMLLLSMEVAWSHWAGQADSCEGLSSILLVGHQHQYDNSRRQSPNGISGMVLPAICNIPICSLDMDVGPAGETFR